MYLRSWHLLQVLQVGVEQAAAGQRDPQDRLDDVAHGAVVGQADLLCCVHEVTATSKRNKKLRLDGTLRHLFCIYFLKSLHSHDFRQTANRSAALFEIIKLINFLLSDWTEFLIFCGNQITYLTFNNPVIHLNDDEFAVYRLHDSIFSVILFLTWPMGSSSAPDPGSHRSRLLQ